MTAMAQEVDAAEDYPARPLPRSPGDPGSTRATLLVHVAELA